MTDFHQELMRARSAYFLDGWLKFNEETWGYRAERVMYTLPGKERPALECVLYLTKSGKVRQPPLNAYLPLQFYPTPTEKNCQLYPQWMSVAKLLAEDIKKRGFAGSISFPPGFTDGRHFQWLGIDVTVRYTFVTPLPINREMVDKRINGHINKATNLKYKALEENDLNMINKCIDKTAEAKSFANLLNHEILQRLQTLLPNNVLGHIAVSETGEIASGQIKLFIPDGICLGLVAGTDREHISNGVNQLITMTAINDLSSKGGKYFDNCGANMESVARAKSAWGFPFVPYITLVDRSAPQLIKRAVAARLPGARSLYHKLMRKTRGGF